MKKLNTKKVQAVMRSVPPQEKVYLKIDWYCKNKRKDTDNIAVGKKFILDGMVEAGVIKNDGWKEVLGFRDSFYVDKDNPRIEVFIHGTDPDKQKDI
jgi:Holliday junction resolvase RusA-like endonuclease